MLLVQGLQAQLHRRFGAMENNHNLTAATLLDPRLKKMPSETKQLLNKACSSLCRSGGANTTL